RAHGDPFAGRHVDLVQSDAAGIHGVVVERGGLDRPPLPAVHGTPVQRPDLTQLASRARAHRTGVLLRGVDPVRETVVGRDVIDLLGVLIVPRAPGLTAVQRDDGALVVAEDDATAVGRIDPRR